MASLKPIIVPGSRRKDGTFLVYIRVYHNGAARRLPTTLVCTSADLTRSMKIKNADILSKADALVRRMRDTLAGVSPFDLEDRDVDWIVGKIRRGMQGTDFRLDFFEFADSFLDSKSVPTRRSYDTALNALAMYLGVRRLDINAISRQMLMDFREWTDRQPKGHWNRKTGRMEPVKKEKRQGLMAARHIGKLLHIYEAAKARYNDEDAGFIPIPKSPFTGVPRKMPPSIGQRNLGPHLMQRLIYAAFRSISEPFPGDEGVRVFVVGFALCGVNLADLYEAKAPAGGVWEYNRKKVRERRADRAYMRVTIPDEIKPLIASLQDGPRGWWLPALHRMAQTSDIATAKVNKGLARWCEDAGVEVFTYGAGRHSWASISRAAGVEKATGDDAMAHKGEYSVFDIYAEKAWNLIDDALREVVGLFNWDAGPDASTSG